MELYFFYNEQYKINFEAKEIDSMILCNNENVEIIYVHENDNLDERHCITISTSEAGEVFTVGCCCDELWTWSFVYNRTNYEVIKYLIMDCIAECSTMNTLIDALDDVFETSCQDMVVYEADIQEGEFECNGDCDNCSFNEDKYIH